MSEEKKSRSKFPPLFWLVVMFEFFERGSYYGMMSVLSVYMTNVLNFAKQDVGDIKATIQPLLYFLPILAGALADRFGYRRMLMIAFGLLGGGYFLTSQSTGYAAVFLSLVVMGLGAGTLFVDVLNNVNIGNVPLGFWMGQQGSIFTFVALIGVYVWRMEKLDESYGIDEERDIAQGRAKSGEAH